MNSYESNVLERAQEWYIAELVAEQNAGQPVNWADYNLDVLREAVKEMVEYDEWVGSLHENLIR